ncbi:MAG TPA: IgGFc-binding protein [Polyangiaceae bacterium]|nr:IgGFc-binding protein [Polyangiaceae bacterium]
MTSKERSLGSARSWRRLRLRTLTLLGGIAAALGACGYDRADRWLDAAEPPPPQCELGQQRCFGTRIQRCISALGGPIFQTEEECASSDQVCNPDGFRCTPCLPRSGTCDGLDAYVCDEAGQQQIFSETCDAEKLQACRAGKCLNPCDEARRRRSNVGCEYWPVDLDNMGDDDTRSAAAQQFAVVLANPDPDVTTEVVIHQDDSQPGQEPQLAEVARALIPPFNLRVFKLGPREVDGSTDGTFGTGTHTALTRHAYRVKSSYPIVAYQFNPLENVNVRSNGASLLKPVEALDPGSSDEGLMYAVLGWPQTIASTSDPDTNLNGNDARAFLTLVGTRPSTRVRVKTTTFILGSGDIPATESGGELTLTLNPFDVANLETDDFNADFTGSIVWADGPVVAFTGNEASDAPFFETLRDRRCCADHLEEQLDHVRTAGRRFVGTVSPNRARAVLAAGAAVGVAAQTEYFRVIATTEAGAKIRTTLEGQYAELTLSGLGDHADFSSTHHFLLDSDNPIGFASISPSQQDANLPISPIEEDNVPNGLPGGDPSLVIVPPIEQFRDSYVFLTPDKYSFDFVRIIATTETSVALDGLQVSDIPSCETAAADGLTDEDRGEPPALVVYTCQLSFPKIDQSKPLPEGLSAGFQNDGVHRVVANQPVGLIVDGFDYRVGYAYAGGTELSFIVPL